MSDFPTLEAMGVTSFSEITKYSLRRESDADVLKIYYRRPKGSLRSRSKKFTFARPRKWIPLEVRGMACWKNLTDSSPTLYQAIEELDKLTQPQPETATQDLKTQFLDDLTHLEKVVNAKLSELRRQIEQLK